MCICIIYMYLYMHNIEEYRRIIISTSYTQHTMVLNRGDLNMMFRKLESLISRCIRVDEIEGALSYV